jgi:anaerobic selenocysteine-containing dehydrogenase
MARVILEENLHDPKTLSRDRAAELAERLKSYPLDSVAERTGLSATTIAEVSREFAATRPCLAMAGEALAFQSNGAESVRAVLLLNRLVGNLNRPGGIYPDPSAAGEGNDPAGLASLIEAMDQGQIETALIHDCNPVHAVPPASGFQEALAKVPFLVSFSPLLDDTARLADLVLPDHTALESWGDVVPAAGTRTPVIGLMQPVVRPVFDTRPFADLLLTVAGELGGETAAAFPQKSYLELLKETVRKAAGLPETDFETNWVALLQKGGLFETPKKELSSFAAGGGLTLPEVAEPRFAGDEKSFPLHLLAYPSTAFYDGRGAALPWLQQLPDPLSTVVWGSWLEINPRTAAELGIAFGDLVEVASPQGSLRLPAVTFPAIRPDMVAIPIGQGHQGAGRYADGRGVNPLVLLAPNGETDGMPTPGATRVRVRKIAAGAELVTAGHPEGSYRNDLIEI